MTEKRYFTDEQVREFVEKSRKAQGLPLKITDPVVLAKVATLMGFRHDLPTANEAKRTPSTDGQVLPEAVDEGLPTMHSADRGVATAPPDKAESFRDGFYRNWEKRR